MIVPAPQRLRSTVSQQTADAFEAMLPSICQAADYAFRKVRPSLRQEMLADVIANAYAAFVRLVERGLERLAYPTVLARFAIRHVRVGRRFGCRQNVLDVMSRYAQRQKGFSVQPLRQETAHGHWQELVVEDRRATPADVATLKVDFSDWLSRLDRFKRRVALRLAAGETSTDAARRFKLTRGRISQLRQELRADWDAFQAAPA